MQTWLFVVDATLFCTFHRRRELFRALCMFPNSDQSLRIPTRLDGYQESRGDRVPLFPEIDNSVIVPQGRLLQYLKISEHIRSITIFFRRFYKHESILPVFHFRSKIVINYGSILILDSTLPVLRKGGQNARNFVAVGDSHPQEKGLPLREK